MSACQSWKIKVSDVNVTTFIAGVSSLGMPGVLWPPQILVDQLTLSQPGGADYGHHIDTFKPSYDPDKDLLSLLFAK